jgi:hypothetical protein
MDASSRELIILGAALVISGVGFLIAILGPAIIARRERDPRTEARVGNYDCARLIVFGIGLLMTVAGIAIGYVVLPLSETLSYVSLYCPGYAVLLLGAFLSQVVSLLFCRRVSEPTTGATYLEATRLSVAVRVIGIIISLVGLGVLVGSLVGVW